MPATGAASGAARSLGAMKMLGGVRLCGCTLDWVRDDLLGCFGPGHRRRVLLPQRGLGLYSPEE